MTNPPLLHGAYLRVERGREHIEDLRKLHDDICLAHAASIVFETAPARLGQFVGTSVHFSNASAPPIADRVSILTGEAFYNLRAALDYLTCALARLDSPSLPRRRKNQFPIEEDREKFAKRRRGWLADISDLHVAVIETMQPYQSGFEWLRHLHDVARFDRHDEPLVISHNASFSVSFDTHTLTSAGLPSPAGAYLGLPSLQIVMPEGLPLLDTLDMIGKQVTVTLDRFAPDFVE